MCALKYLLGYMLVFVFCLSVLRADNQNQPNYPSQTTGAWIQKDLKWKKAPKSVNPKLESSEATILFFGEDHTFALLVCIVNRVPGEYTAISNGDGVALYRGQWLKNPKGIAISYVFVPNAPRQWPEIAFGGVGKQEGIVHRRRDVLSFANMTFEREPDLDEDANHAASGASSIIEPYSVK